MMKQINTHDKFFKETFKRTENVRDLIQGILPNDVLSKMDLTTLKKIPASYIDKLLKESFADLAYTVTYNNSCTLKIALLFEHKSYKVDYPHFQLIQYMLNIWQADIKDHKKPMPVIPIIFYHGTDSWEYRPIADYFNGIDDAIKKYLPIFDYVLFDLSQTSHAEIKDKIFKTIIGKMAVLLMKYIFDETKLNQHLTDIFEITVRYNEQENVIDFLESVFRYIYANTDMPTETILQEIQKVSTKGGEKAMSTATKLIEQGRQEGRKEGREDALQEGRDALQEAFNRLIKKGMSPQEAKEALGI